MENRSTFEVAGHCGVVLFVIFALATPAPAAEPMPPGRQNALVKKYCAVCHTDQAANGGLSLEHYDAADADPALAAMLLSKLQNNAMGAAGLGIPDQATRDAWVEATAAQARGASHWTVMRTPTSESKTPVLSASMVRGAGLRGTETGRPVYRLTLACDIASHAGNIQLTWAPTPQTDRTFFVSSDGGPAIPHKLAGREKMGNGSAATTGRASATLDATSARKTITITDLFPGETVVFPLDDLDSGARREMSACFQPLSVK